MQMTLAILYYYKIVKFLSVSKMSTAFEIIFSCFCRELATSMLFFAKCENRPWQRLALRV